VDVAFAQTLAVPQLPPTLEQAALVYLHFPVLGQSAAT